MNKYIINLTDRNKIGGFISLIVMVIAVLIRSTPLMLFGLFGLIFNIEIIEVSLK